MYILENFENERTVENKVKKDLVQAIIKTRRDLNNCINNYEYAEGEMIDYYLYQIKANQSKLSYLVKEAKKNKMKIENIAKVKFDA